MLFTVLVLFSFRPGGSFVMLWLVFIPFIKSSLQRFVRENVEAYQGGIPPHFHLHGDGDPIGENAPTLI